jgi:uncharacterized protein YndB with AHSA1/START domain
VKTETLGMLRRDGKRRAVRQERRYAAPPDEVWAALTRPEHVRNWLAEMSIEPREGGRVTFEWDGGHTAQGVVRVFDPPNTFEYTWDHDGPSIIRFELEPDGDGTLLVLDHTNIAVESAAGIGAGWHSHIEALDALLAGSSQRSTEWTARYEALLPDYQEQASAL